VIYSNREYTVGVNVQVDKFIPLDKSYADSVELYFNTKRKVGFPMAVVGFMSIPIIRWDEVTFELSGEYLYVSGKKEDSDGNRYNGSATVKIKPLSDAYHISVTLSQKVMKQVLKILKDYKGKDMVLWIVEGGMMAIEIGDVKIYAAGLKE